MAVWTLTIQEIINYFSALTGAKVSADVSELVKDLHINRSEETYPYLAPVGLGSTLITLVRGFPATTGGQKIAPLFQSITTDGTYYTATDAGVITRLPAKDVVFSLLNALGVSVTYISAGVETAICNALSNIYGKEVTWENIHMFSVLAVVHNGSLMLDEATVKAFSDSLYAQGVFSGSVTWDLPTVDEYYSLNSFNYAANAMSTDKLITMIDTAFKPVMVPQYVSEANYNIMKNALPAFLANNLPQDVYESPVFILELGMGVDNVYDTYRLEISIYYNSSIEDFTASYPSSYRCYMADNVDTVRWLNISGVNTIKAFRYDFRSPGWTTRSNSAFIPSIGSGFIYAVPYYSTKRVGTWYYSTIAGILTSLIEGTTFQNGATLPTDDLDVEDRYPAWASAGVSAGFWDDAAQLLRTRKMVPVSLQEEKEVYDTPQALARDGVVDHAALRAKQKILDGTLDVLDEPTDWVDEGTRTKTLEVPDAPEPKNTDTPPVVLPNGTAGGPVTVYNPTQAQMDSLRTELWNNGLVTSIQALFNANPMDAIISCHMIYASPHVDATKKGLYLGNVFMNVSGVNVVDEQFIEVDCGTVIVPELFGNATDYEPYTSVEIYLPFIGIQQLSANDVVGGSVNLVMKEDVLTGAILAEVTVSKNGNTQTLYQFTGNGAVQIPLTGQDRLSQIMGGIKGALSGGFTGGVAGALMGAASGAIASKPSIMKSGGFSPNTGAMAGKLPYLIINRNVPLDASEYNKFTGYPSNKKVNLGSVSGFTKVKDVHVEGIICTEQEKTLIEEALKEGIFL